MELTQNQGPNIQLSFSIFIIASQRSGIMEKEIVNTLRTITHVLILHIWVPIRGRIILNTKQFQSYTNTP